MPKVKANKITLNYESQGNGEPLILIPYLSADHACYGFQVAEYAKHFNCISIDLRGTGESDKPEADYSTADLAEDVAAFMETVGIERAHISGLSLGAAVGMWLAARYPGKVKSLSLHGAWPRTDAFLKTVVEGWQVTAKALVNESRTVAEMVILSIFPWCFTPELYATRADYVQSLADFVRSRPVQALPDFIRQSNAVIAHEVEDQLGRITAPTQITFGRYDMLTSHFGNQIKEKIRDSELVVFEGCAHAPIYEKVDEFNQTTLAFLQRHTEPLGMSRAI